MNRNLFFFFFPGKLVWDGCDVILPSHLILIFGLFFLLFQVESSSKGEKRRLFG